MTKHFPGRSSNQIGKKIFELRCEQRKAGKKVPAHLRVGLTISNWNEAELERLKEGVRRFGRDCVKIADIIKTKD